jgi:hypothetical protein
MDPRNLVCTNTTRFIVPMLFKNSNYTKILDNGFFDSYSYDYYELKYDNKVIIVRNDNELPKADYNPIDKFTRQNQNCFVYDIPDEFKKDYEYIVRNKYDGLSNEYIKLYSTFWEDSFEFPKQKYKPVEEIYRVAV